MAFKIGKMLGIHPYGWIFQLLILIVFILIIYWVLKSNKKDETAIEILSKRYAKGEISEKEFDKIRKQIE